MSQRVVVGVDGSAPASAALAWAARLALGTGRSLTAALVVEPRWGLAEDDPRRILDQAVAALPGGVRETVSAAVLEGDPAERLAALAGEGLLVIGTHKTGFLRGRVLGSRGLRVAALAAGCVAVVPVVAVAGRRGVIAGIEPSCDPGPVVLAAARHAERLGEPLVLVHALDEPPVYAAAAAVDPGRIAIAAAAHLVAERHPGVALRSRESARPAAEAFLDASLSASLLVVGVTRRERESALAGSTLHDVLLNANAPVLAVPAGP